MLTIAAYNAGPNRVAQWIPKDRTLPADIWIETIPYKETRNYLRNILAYIAVYEKRLGQTHRPLHTRMPPNSTDTNREHAIRSLQFHKNESINLRYGKT